MVKKVFKTLALVFITAALVFGAAACGMSNDPEGGNITPNETYPNGGDTVIPTPNVPEEGITEPITELPKVDTDALKGDADKTGAAAVITLKGDTAEFAGENVKVNAPKTWTVDVDGTTITANYGTVVEISKSGVYVLEGVLNNGFIAISKKDLEVTLVLNGVNIYSKNFAPIASTKKSAVTIELAPGSTNYLTDGGTGSDGAFVNAYDDNKAPNAALFVRTDLTIKGSGKLIVNGVLNNGIGSRGTLTIENGNITVNAVNNALKGNDSITIKGGTLNLGSKQDGIKSEADESDPALGWIKIEGGAITVNAVNDAIQAGTDLTVSNAVLCLRTGGGSAATVTADSAKGLKANGILTVHSGEIDIDSNDDAIHSNGTVVINGGTITLASGDDGIHADSRLTINGGVINISKSYEGLESLNIDLNGGEVKLLSTDDGINISGGKDASATVPNRPGPGGGRPGQQPGGGSGAIDGTLTITGGTYMVNASGDGLDSNGSIVMSGGTVIVYGPTSNNDAPIDYDGSFTMTGGTIVALGSSGMAQQPSSTTQYSFLAKFTSSVASNTLIHVAASAGAEIVTVKTLKNTACIVVCSPSLAKGNYTISKGGSYSGGVENCGLYSGGTYSGGTTIKSFTINNTISSY